MEEFVFTFLGWGITWGEKKASVKKKRMVATVMFEEFVSKQQYKDAEEMTQWRKISLRRVWLR